MSNILHNHFNRAENTSEYTPMSNKNEFTSLRDGRDCLPEQIHGAKNKKQSSTVDMRKSQVTQMKSQQKSLIRQAGSRKFH